MSPTTISLIAFSISFFPLSLRPLSVQTASAVQVPTSVRTESPQTTALRTTIDSMITMLKAREYRPFLSRFMPPELVEQYGVDAMTGMFDGAKGDLLLSVLKEIRNSKPLYSKDGAAATYKVKKRPGLPHDQISFIRISDLWYLTS